MMNTETSFWLPRNASALSQPVDSSVSTYGLIAVLVAFFIIAVLLLTAIINKAKNDDASGVPLSNINWKAQIILQATLAISVALFFYSGLHVFVQQVIPPNDALLVTASADSGHVTFNYVIGSQTDTLTVQTQQSILLNLQAADASYGLSIPELRVKSTITPNRITRTWFSVKDQGTIPIYIQHNGVSRRMGVLISKGKEEYSEWVAQTFDPSGGKSPEEFGEALFTKKGCIACHSLDGTAVIGPSIKGLFGSKRKLTSGKTLLADEEYIKRSITEPAVDIAAGFSPVMAPFALSDQELDALVAYMKKFQ